MSGCASGPAELPRAGGTLVDAIVARAQLHPAAPAQTFLVDGEEQVVQRSFGEIDRRARAIAAALQAVTEPGERALLVHPPGPELIEAFLGCLYAGVVAVPAYPPDPLRLARTLPGLLAIADDARPSIVLTTAFVLEHAGLVFEHAPALAALRWLATDAVPSDDASRWTDSALTPADIAFLQYSSGSTRAPRGVVLSHGNLVANTRMIAAAFEIDPVADCVVSWLPTYHDMGLIGGVLAPLLTGTFTVLLSPLDFLKRPMRWLRAISRHRGTISGAPNFAYDLCVRKSTREERAALDLSSWSLAFSGAEPVRPDTLDRFALAFAPSGFRAEAFYPCYGLAEATLIVSGKRRAARPTTLELDADALERLEVATPRAQARRVRLVRCGPPVPETELRIVDPESGRPLAPDAVGEIQVRSASVAVGYWNRLEETEDVFVADGVADAERRWLRTGDLGFLDEGELVPVGRIKDLIVIRGRNLHPQDVEACAEEAHAALRPGCAAAFAVETVGGEGLVVCLEVETLPPGEADLVTERIVAAVQAELGVRPIGVSLLERRTLLKTSSGKVQRLACRAAWLARSLDVVFEWREAGASLATGAAPRPTAAAPRSAREIRAWLRARIGAALGTSPEQVDTSLPLAELGLDSAALAEAIGELEAWLETRIAPTLFWHHPTIETAAQALAESESHTAPVLAPAVRETAPAAVPLAIVGIGCRFPGAHGPDAFWRLLLAGETCIGPAPPGHPGAGVGAGGIRRRAGFLADVRGFDARFFRISPREADRMDPQQRLLLEVAYEALEDAGLAPTELAGSAAGVFVGISQNDYQLLWFREPRRLDGHALTGTAHSIAANRLSYVFDLRGPSIAIDTACSSSLVAIHLASQSVRAGESSIALAGGVNTLLVPELDAAFSSAGMLAPGGLCRTFDTAAEGYVRGEGCGLVVLKRLDQAQLDGDRIYAVLRGSALVQDGRSNGLTAPSGPAQQETIRSALRRAGVPASHLAYVEAHGTGTPLGDPIELESLRAVLAEDPPSDGPCFVGSVKTNIGHLEAAAGIAGLVKTALALRHGTIPAHLHLAELNPRIDLGAGLLAIPSRSVSWPASPTRVAAGVSSFGFGGTNAHVVLERPATPVLDPGANGLDPPVLLLSARSEAALRARAGAVAAWWKGREDSITPADLRLTCNTRRDHLVRRLAVVAEGADETRGMLERFARDDPSAGVQAGEAKEGAPRVAFVFAGQGTGRTGLGRELYARAAAFRATLDRCDEVLGTLRGKRLLSWLFDPPADSRVLPTDVSQPLLFALTVALADFLRAIGIEPAAVVGHSVGELAASCVAGAVPLEDGLRFAAERGRLMQQLAAPGAMAAVLGPARRVEEVLAACGTSVSVAARNAPACTVVAGPPAEVDEVLRRLEAEGLEVRPLRVERAFHSSAIEPCLPGLAAAAGAIAWRPTTLPMASTLDAALRAPGFTPDAAHWCAHAREAVRFDAAIRALDATGCDAFVELGPGAGLRSFGAQILPGALWLSLLDSTRGDRVSIASTLAGLHVRGARALWRELHPARSARVVSLPPYPFEHQDRWLPEAASIPPTAPAEQELSALLPAVPASFVEHALRAPDAVAIRSAAEAIGYDALDRWSSGLARTLSGFGVGPGRTVGLASQPGAALLAGALAIWKTGATVALLPSTRSDTLACLSRCEVQVALVSRPLADRLVGFAGEAIWLDPEREGSSRALPASQGPLAQHEQPGAAPVLVACDPTVPGGTRGVSRAGLARLFALLDARASIGAGDRLHTSGAATGTLDLLHQLWALSRGASVECQGPRRTGGALVAAPHLPSLSLSFFGIYPPEPAPDKYRLVVEAARLADRLGFEAVWTPERHFDAFGGAFPAPAVMSAALARETERIALRAGSVVLPLHHPVRVAEEWALVDNLSEGRAGLALASGWNARDFVLAPNVPVDRAEAVARGLALLRRLWRGEAVRVPAPTGGEEEIRLHPLPHRPELPVWLTILRNPKSWERAAQLGTHVLTNLMGQSVEDLGVAITSYRDALDRAGRVPRDFHATVLLHTFVGADLETDTAAARGPLAEYLRGSVGLFRGAHRFPWLEDHLAALTPEEREQEIDALTTLALERYLATHALIGDAPRCRERLERLGAAGVDEVACLIDFGLDRERVLAGIERLAALRKPPVRSAPCVAPEASLALPSTTCTAVVRGAETRVDLLETESADGPVPKHGALDALAQWSALAATPAVGGARA